MSGELTANERLRTIYYVFNVGVTKFDKEAWETVGTFENLLDSSDKKCLSLLNTVEAHYFKFVVTRIHGYQNGTVWFIVGELGAY